MKIYLVDIDGELYEGELILKREQEKKNSNGELYTQKSYDAIFPENADLPFDPEDLTINEIIRKDKPTLWEAYIYHNDWDDSCWIPGQWERGEFFTFSAEEAERVRRERREKYEEETKRREEVKKIKESLSKIRFSTPWVEVGEIKVEKIASKLDSLEALEELKKLVDLLDTALSGF